MTAIITTTCPVTGEPLKPGETVSRTAVNQLTTLISDLPSLMASAEAALQGLHHGDQQGPAGIPDSRPPLNLSTLEDLDPIRDTIDAWAASIAHEYTPGLRYQAGDWRMARQLIRHHQDKLRRWQDSPQLIDDLTTNIHALERLVSPQRRSTLSVGDCPSCGNPMRAKPHDAEATCRKCGTTIDLEALRDEARIRTSWKKLPRHQAREAAGDVLGYPIPENTVKSWIRRGKITEYPQPNGRPPLIAVRDLVDLAMAPKARPANAHARG